MSVGNGLFPGCDSRSAPTVVTAPIAVSLNCGRKIALYLEPGTVVAECTEPDGHPGNHYDQAFGRSWGEAK